MVAVADGVLKTYPFRGSITRSHLHHGSRYSPSCCPATLAVTEAVNRRLGEGARSRATEVVVTQDLIRFRFGGRLYEGATPGFLATVVSLIDAGLAPADEVPFEFSVTEVESDIPSDNPFGD